jgi:hypothetical protein
VGNFTVKPPPFISEIGLVWILEVGSWKMEAGRCK